MAEAAREGIGVCMLTFSMPPEHSGAAKQAITLASKLSARGVRIFFVTQASSKEAQASREVANFDVLRVYKKSLPWKLIAPARFFCTLYKKRREFSILHVHGYGYLGKIAVVFARMFRKKVIIKMTMFTEDDPMSIRRGRLGWLNLYFFSKASHYIAITPAFRKSYEEAKLPSSKLSIIPNGVDTQRFRPLAPDERRALRLKLNLPKEKTLLAYAGLIRPEKGIDFLLDVCSSLHRRAKDTALLLMGPIESWFPQAEKDYAARMLARINDELQGVVYFVGNVSNVEQYFQAADIFVSASHREGLPNVLLEAMATGLAPVVVEIPGVHAQVLRDGENGVIVKERSVSRFADEIAHLIDEPDRRRALSTAALKTVTAGYSADQVAGQYLQLYQHLHA